MGYHSTEVLGNMDKAPTKMGGSGCYFNVAVNEKWKDKNSGELKEHTQWYSVNVYGHDADFLLKYAKKGDMIFVKGRLSTYEDKENNFHTNLKADPGKVELLGKRDRSNDGQKEYAGGNDDLPF